MTKPKKPLISIITASYNYSDFIEETINSVLKQTYKNWELLVVDDGSSDNSINIIKKYSENHVNIHLYTHKNNSNKGLQKTIELGIKKAKGKYIAFLESDDFWETTNLEKKVQEIELHPEAKVIYNNINPFGDENQLNIMSGYINRCRSLSKDVTTPKDISKYFIISTIIPTLSCLMVEKKVLKNCNFNSPILAYLDWWLESQLCFKTKALYIDEKLTNWRIHPQSYIGRTKKDKNITEEKNFIRSIIKQYKKISPKKYESFLVEAIEYKLKKHNHEVSKTKKEALIETIKTKKVYLYGAGSFLKSILSKIEESGINIAGIIDGDKNKKGSLINTYRVFHKNDMPELNPEVVVLTVEEPSLLYFDLQKYIVEKNLKSILLADLFTKEEHNEGDYKNRTIEDFLMSII